ncbi:glutathionylspermidine synthase family protein [Clostridium frigidicarnis]|uniref:Glutathionylspermidine synthase n=1 Tax=Clostridium frigidicarnis TaxID=84698 RepID=A0A1I1AYJ5_9CLOT|nr:glutathionylspermidine synthase family protein [Clostridium frigidicarnis]SFB43169.1 Glutathionylspermidine synthase [Clostridium frigidicarnis]
MKDQKNFTEDGLFNNYIVSSSYENLVHCQIPFFIDSNFYSEILFYSEEINKLCLKVLDEITSSHKDLLNYIDNFSYKDNIFNLKCPLSPMFWTRFDTFREDNDKIFFSEFNYDKPCAQKEISLSGKLDFENNINKNFEKTFISKLTEICDNLKSYNVAVLIDPCHYEELYLAYYFKHLFINSNINIIQVGPQNLCVKNDSVYAFNDIKINIILRLFPTEYFEEIDTIHDILKCFDEGNVSIINDPRVVAIQAKSFFAYLWDLVNSDSILLSNREKNIIKQCIPYTFIFKASNYNEVLKNKDKYVLKPSFGRYSDNVYIGSFFNYEEWNNILISTLKSNRIYIVQDLINIKKEYTYAPSDNNMNIPSIAYGNFGAYLIDKSLEGICIRWSNTLLTNNDTTWMCPIGIKYYPLALEKHEFLNRKFVLDKVTERSSFEYNFTGSYTNINEYISLNSMIIDKKLYNDLYYCSSMFCKILRKTSKLVSDNFNVFYELLGIPSNIKDLVLNSHTNVLCALGRIDFALDNNGVLKILEFNSETPAGVVESIGINKIIKEELNISYCDPNNNLRDKIKNVFYKILKDFSSNINIKNIGFLSTSYYEDVFTTSILSDICSELQDFNIIVGNIYDLQIENDKVYLYGTELQAIYRHFPLDWISYDEELIDLINLLNRKTFVINPTHTLITQSKAFLAVIYELIGKNFYDSVEEDFIEKHIPYTCLEPNNILSRDCLIKPYLSREGGGIVLSYEGIRKNVDNVIFQDRVNTLPFYMDRYSTIGYKKLFQFPVMGVFIADDEPCGIFTRMGDFITNESAIFISTYVRHVK